MSRFVVTGGSGFIGSNIVMELERSGHEIVVIDDLSSGHRSNLMPSRNVRFVEASILDDVLLPAFKGADAVFHLAASVGNKRSIDFPLLDTEINVVGTLRVLEACRAAGVPKVVVSSSAGIFGELKQLPIREDHPIDPDTPYGASKLAAEKLTLAYAKLGYFEAICLRYFNVYGRHQRFDQYGNVIPIFVYQHLAGKPITIFGDGEQTRDFVNVRDVVQANINAAMAKGVSGAFNLGSGRRITINKLVALIQDVSGMEANVRYLPPRPGDVLHSLADISSAEKQLKFNPQVAIEDGLAEYVEWVAQSQKAAA